MRFFAEDEVGGDGFETTSEAPRQGRWIRRGREIIVLGVVPPPGGVSSEFGGIGDLLFGGEAEEAEHTAVAESGKNKTTKISRNGEALRSALGRSGRAPAQRLFDILENQVTDVVGGKNKGRHQFDCAEPQAVGALALQDVPLESIRITSIKNERGEDAEPCRNCSQWLVGSSDGYRVNPKFFPVTLWDHIKVTKK